MEPDFLLALKKFFGLTPAYFPGFNAGSPASLRRSVRQCPLHEITNTKLPTTDTYHAQLIYWLAAVARRDAEAFRLLYDATSPKLFGFALRILNKRELAEEVLQESFVNIWNQAGKYEPALAAPMTWLTTIVRNKAFDLLRRTADTVELDADAFDKDIMNAWESNQPGPAEALQLSGDAKALAHCLTTLDSSPRQAIVLAYFHDLSNSEVAGHLSVPIGTVKTWIRRGLERLRLCLSRTEAR